MANWILSWLSLVLSFLVLSLGIAGICMGPDHDRIRQTEFREASSFPSLQEIKQKELRALAAQVEAALTDRVLFRFFLLRVYSKLFDLIGQSAFPERVIRGMGGWFFLGNQFGEVMDKARGIKVFGREELNQRLQFIQEKQEICRARGVPFLFVVPPDKQSVYPEYLPPWTRLVSPIRSVDLVREAATTAGLAFIDLTPVVVAAKEFGVPVFYRADSHWNRIGAYYGFREIIKEMQRQEPDILWPASLEASLTAGPEPHDTDLLRIGLLQAVRLPNDDNRMFWFQSIPDQAVVRVTSANGNTSEILLKNPYWCEKGPDTFASDIAVNDKTVLLARDSFFNNLQPYFSVLFKKTVQIHNSLVTNESLAELMETVRPDFVIWEVVERSL